MCFSPVYLTTSDAENHCVLAGHLSGSLARCHFPKLCPPSHFILANLRSSTFALLLALSRFFVHPCSLLLFALWTQLRTAKGKRYNEQKVAVATQVWHACVVGGTCTVYSPLDISHWVLNLDIDIYCKFPFTWLVWGSLAYYTIDYVCTSCYFTESVRTAIGGVRCYSC